MEKQVTEKLNPDSIELSKNAKGQFTYVIKHYGDLSSMKGQAKLVQDVRQTVQDIERFIKEVQKSEDKKE